MEASMIATGSTTNRPLLSNDTTARTVDGLKQPYPHWTHTNTPVQNCGGRSFSKFDKTERHRSIHGHLVEHKFCHKAVINWDWIKDTLQFGLNSKCYHENNQNSTREKSNIPLLKL